MDRINELVKELDQMIKNKDSGTKAKLLAQAKLMEIAAIIEDLDNVTISDETFDGLSNETKILMVTGFVMLMGSI